MSLHIRALQQWRRLACIVAEAARRTIGAREVYVAGGAAEERLTISSDIDIVIPVDRELSLEEAAETKARILEEAERLRLPDYAPVEIHLVHHSKLKHYPRLEPVCTTAQGS